jgi:serine/threonine-protein kinase HipA
VGHNGMGALVYEPEITGAPQRTHENLDEIDNEILEFHTKDNDQFVDDLLALNGSSAGARPKILAPIDNDDWIIKFRSFLDPKDAGPIEYAYHLMAKSAQLNIPEAKLFASKNGPGYFGVKRFDRSQGDHLHMHSISGLLHVDHATPSLDYENIMKATLWLTKDDRESEKQFRVAAFNVLTHNRDDHAKNFSFLMDSNGLWRASPSYDITYSSGPAGEHCTTIMGEGKNPNRLSLMKLAQAAGIKTQTAHEIIDEVRIAVSNWGHFAQEASVSNTSTKRIKSDMARIDQIFTTMPE